MIHTLPIVAQNRVEVVSLTAQLLTNAHTPVVQPEVQTADTQLPPIAEVVTRSFDCLEDIPGYSPYLLGVMD